MKAKTPKIRARVEDVLRVRLDGAELWDVRQYVAEKQQAGEEPWALRDGENPLSDRQLYRYLAAADALVAESCRTSRQKLLRNHLAQRRKLFARAVAAGDVKAALAVLQDIAKLQGLYPSEDDVLRREAEALRKRLTELKGTKHGDRNGEAAAGAGGPGERGAGGPQPDPGG
jgi:hypothetical protein